MTVQSDHKGLEQAGIFHPRQVYWNLPTPTLYEEAVRRNEASISHLGPLVVRTGLYTGRAPENKFVVNEPSSTADVWWGAVNQSFAPADFDALHQRMNAYLQARDLFVQDCWAGADATYRQGIRVISETAWHSLFARNLFIHPNAEELANFAPDFTVINCPNFRAVPALDKTRAGAFVIIHFGRKLVLIGGTSYAGETKKSVFSILNFLLPFANVLPMHCSANYGADNDVALFFGLSGTGKTTLSADPARTLIGDDEHGWSADGVFNFEGGCYAKVINLAAEDEPDIFQTTRRFGTILENVVLDDRTRRLALDDASITENTRAAYPITQITNATRSGRGGHPQNIIFLTADAFGVLPPIARLTPEQTIYHFLSGYTAKVAGTEAGVHEPQAAFSTCFGAPFLTRPPRVYADLLGQKLADHPVTCWLVNTGWTGGPYGVGSRIKIAYTRAMIKAALAGELADVPYMQDERFGLSVPTACPGVPATVLTPRHSWSDRAAYDAQAQNLARMFAQNFQQFAGDVSAAVRAAGPRVT